MKTSVLFRLRRLTLTALAAGALFAVHAPNARAALAVIDQQDAVNNNTFQVGSNTFFSNVAGESFVPTLPVMNAATVLLLSTGGSTTLTLSVYAGAGFSGTPLATSPSVTVSSPTLQTIEFDLPGVVALTPGNTYTLALTRLSGTATSFQGGTDINNSYASGIFYLTGNSFPAFDLTFAEGVTNAALLGVPEPPTWAAVALGTVGLGVVTLRRHVRGA